MSKGIRKNKVQEVSPRVAPCLPVALMFFCLSGLLFVNPDAIAADGDKLWNWEAMPVAKATYDQKHVRLTTDGYGGAIMIWQDYRSADWDIYAQRLDYDGNPLWTDNGVIIATSTTNRQLAPEIVQDGAGGAVVTWWTRIGTSQYDPWMVFAQRINASGAVQWTANGVQVSTDVHITPTMPLNNLSITTDTAGGALVAFETATTARVVHIDGNGDLVGPGVHGVDLGAGVLIEGGPAITGDGAGGAIIAWSGGGFGGKNIVAQRVTSDLSLPWGATPTVISTDPRRESRPDIVSDGSGGALITWVAQPELGDPPGTHVLVQRIDGGGNSLWTSGGVILVDSETVGGSSYAWSGYEVAPVVASDGIGGAIVAWNDWRNEPGAGGNDDIFAQRVDGVGLPQWIANGVPLHPYPGGSQRRPQIVSYGEGRAIVTLQDMGLGSWDIYAVAVDEDGDRSWTSYVYYDAGPPSVTAQTDPRIVFDGTGPVPTGAIIAWVDDREDSAYAGTDIYAQKLEVATSIPTEAPSNLEAHQTPDRIHLTWQYNSNDETGFRVEYKLSPGGSWQTLAIVDPHTTFYQMVYDIYQTYYFRVAAFNSYGDGPYSNVVSIYTARPVNWIRVDSPNGGEEWRILSTQEISWSSGVVGLSSVNLYYATDTRCIWKPIQANVQNTGSYNWQVPVDISNTCLVKIESTSSPGYDLSNEYFSIKPLTPAGRPRELPGDLNGDCQVDFCDLAAMAANWLKDISISPVFAHKWGNLR